MMTEYGYPMRCITAMLEVKNAWQVTPARIDQVIQSIPYDCVISNFSDTVPLDSVSPARLALEQLYGYMVCKTKAYDVLTTMNGWYFLHRENDYISHLCSATSRLEKESRKVLLMRVITLRKVSLSCKP